MKKKLQLIFKSLFKLLFKLVYGKIIYSENNLFHSNITIYQIKDKELLDSKKNYYNL